MLKAIVACMALALVVPAGAAQARPFTAKDLALLDRVSDPRISPDARFVAYSVRSTDWDGNHGFNALWVLDRGAQNSAPRLVRDQERSTSSRPAQAQPKSGARRPRAAKVRR
jgi:dipeptidyl aminopeptidase/acylaminoacyl peptidase